MRTGRWSELITSAKDWVTRPLGGRRAERSSADETPFPARQGGLPVTAKAAGERTSMVSVLAAQCSARTDSEHLAELATKIRSAVENELDRRVDELIADPFAEPVHLFELETGGHFGVSLESAISIAGQSVDDRDTGLIRRIIGAECPAEITLQRDLDRLLREAFAPKYEITTFENRARGVKPWDLEETGWETSRELAIRIQPTDPADRAAHAARQAEKIAALEPQLREAIADTLEHTKASEVVVLGEWSTHDYNFLVTAGTAELDIVHGGSSWADITAGRAIIDNTRPDLRVAFEETVRRALPADRELTGFKVKDGALIACLVATR